MTARAARSGTMSGVSARADLPVSVFDSGVGGLTVLHELLVSLPSAITAFYSPATPW